MRPRLPYPQGIFSERQLTFRRRLTSSLAPALILVLAVSTEAAPRPQEGYELPRISFKDSAAKEVDAYSLLREKPLLIVFVQADKRLSKRLLEDLPRSLKGIEGVEALIVFCGSRGGKLPEAAKLLKPPFRAVVDPERKAYSAMGIVALPTAYVVNREGKLLRVRRGYAVSMAKELAQGLRVALGAIEDPGQSGESAELSADDTKRKRRLQLVDRCLSEGRLDAALKLLDGILKDQPGEPQATGRRALALHLAGRPEAFEALQEAHRLAPKATRVTLALASLLIEREAYSEAEVLIRKAIAGNPHPASAYYQLGELYSKTERWKEAAEAYREAARRGVEGRR